ncbi:flavin-containing monooxygenase [Jatrophihabitans sp. YIM 134969]
MTDLSDASAMPPGASVEADAADLRADQRLPRRTHVLVVGSGFSGLATVIGLTQAGYRDVVVIDRGRTVGGTWRDNTYPGAACDVPSQLYSFSFALNPDWSSSYSPQPEIERYLQGVTETFGVGDHVYGGVEMTGARWDAAAAEWEVTTSAGDIRAKVLALGIGALCEPRLPAIDGIGDFAGPVMHSSRWDHSVDLRGKRVAVIGTGASAIQIVPKVAEVAAHLDVYQRTPPWIVPRNDHPYGRVARFAMRHVPGFQKLMRTSVYWYLESRVLGFVKQPKLMGSASKVALAHLHHAVKDPDLRAKLTPDYTMGCKRILISNDYYPAVAADTTELVTDPIREVRPHSIVTADGTEREIDVLIVATGFFVTDNPTAQLVHGVDGVSLAEFWDEHGMSAYKGVTVPGFPNMFYLLGPNTGLGHSSMVQMAEAHANYTVDAVRTMDRHGLASVELRPEVLEEYERGVQRAMSKTVWATGNCASWYNDKHGNNTTLWPGFTFTFRRMLQRFDLAGYRSVATADLTPSDPEKEFVA